MSRTTRHDEPSAANGHRRSRPDCQPTAPDQAVRSADAHLARFGRGRIGGSGSSDGPGEPTDRRTDDPSGHGASTDDHDYGAAEPPIVSGAADDGGGRVICWPTLILFGFLIAGFAAISSARVIP